MPGRRIWHDRGASGPQHRDARVVEEVFRGEWARAAALIARATGDLSRAEDAVQDAFAVALDRWPRDGVPANPAAWILTTARNRAIDGLRRDRVHSRAVDELAAMWPAATWDTHVDDGMEIPDERLALIFTCCHPALSEEAQVALTLRLVGGLTTDEIARAFLTGEATMAQRLVRAKRKVRDAAIPIRVPGPELLPERLGAVLSVVYLVFNAGYSSAARGDVAAEAVRLGAVLQDLMPEQSEVHALQALMLLHHARRRARRDGAGNLVLLEDQDRALWDAEGIRQGLVALHRAMPADGLPGHYLLQATIAACHAQATRPEDTDWRTIAILYGQLAHSTSSPVVELNRAVAVAMSEGPRSGLDIVAALEETLDGYYLLHATRADLLRRLGLTEDARAAYRRAHELAPTDEERAFLAGRLGELGAVPEPPA